VTENGVTSFDGSTTSRSSAYYLDMSANERIVGRPWTKHEDNLLKQAVDIHGENDNWKTVALSVPGRTNKACRKVSIFMYEQRMVFVKY